jgi:hypothetical protein
LTVIFLNVLLNFQDINQLLLTLHGQDYILDGLNQLLFSRALDGNECSLQAQTLMIVCQN